MPNWVNQRAEQILEKLESDSDVQRNQDAIASTDNAIAPPQANGQIQMTMFGIEPHPLLEKIRSLEPTEITPLHALGLLQEWKTELGTEDQANSADAEADTSRNQSSVKTG